MQGKRYETWGYGPLSHSECSILIAVNCLLVRLQGNSYETWGYGPLSHSESILITIYCLLVRLSLILVCLSSLGIY